ncbi:MAG: hypothetical protein H7293_05465 [Candidatus Saccharibacteria bacterium]|nr:hypothetical protein [Rhodoferax sp.]
MCWPARVKPGLVLRIWGCPAWAFSGVSRCQHFWTACKVVSTSDLLFTMPERYARATNGPLGNQLIPFPITVSAHDIFLYWHASADNDPANRWLRNNIIATFEGT